MSFVYFLSSSFGITPLLFPFLSPLLSFLFSFYCSFRPFIFFCFAVLFISPSSSSSSFRFLFFFLGSLFLLFLRLWLFHPTLFLSCCLFLSSVLSFPPQVSSSSSVFFHVCIFPCLFSVFPQLTIHYCVGSCGLGGLVFVRLFFFLCSLAAQPSSARLSSFPQRPPLGSFPCFFFAFPYFEDSSSGSCLHIPPPAWFSLRICPPRFRSPDPLICLCFLSVLLLQFLLPICSCFPFVFASLPVCCHLSSPLSLSCVFVSFCCPLLLLNCFHGCFLSHAVSSLRSPSRIFYTVLVPCFSVVPMGAIAYACRSLSDFSGCVFFRKPGGGGGGGGGVLLTLFVFCSVCSLRFCASQGLRCLFRLLVSFVFASLSGFGLVGLRL